MKLKIIKKAQIEESMITIEYMEGDQKVEDIIEYIEFLGVALTGKLNDRIYRINLEDIFYIESSENQCFLYTKNESFDCKYRLNELETIHPFLIRVNKNVVINYRKIKNFKSTFNGKLEACLINNDRIEISRRYVSVLKSVLGGNK